MRGAGCLGRAPVPRTASPTADRAMDFFVWRPDRIGAVAGAFLILALATAVLGRSNPRFRSWPLFAAAALWALYAPYESWAHRKGWNIRVDLLLFYPILLAVSIAALAGCY